MLGRKKRGVVSGENNEGKLMRWATKVMRRPSIKEDSHDGTPESYESLAYLGLTSQESAAKPLLLERAAAVYLQRGDYVDALRVLHEAREAYQWEQRKNSPNYTSFDEKEPPQEILELDSSIAELEHAIKQDRKKFLIENPTRAPQKPKPVSSDEFMDGFNKGKLKQFASQLDTYRWSEGYKPTAKNMIRNAEKEIDREEIGGAALWFETAGMAYIKEGDYLSAFDALSKARECRIAFHKKYEGDFDERSPSQDILRLEGPLSELEMLLGSKGKKAKRDTFLDRAAAVLAIAFLGASVLFSGFYLTGLTIVSGAPSAQSSLGVALFVLGLVCAFFVLRK